MIHFKCPVCGEEQSIVSKYDLKKVIRTICIGCGIPLVLMLVVLTQEQALRKKFKKKEEQINAHIQAEAETEKQEENPRASSNWWKKHFKKEKRR